MAWHFNPGSSLLVKVFGIGALTLVLLIPAALTRGVVDDRRAIEEGARADIMRSWGGRQVLGGPVLVLPYRDSWVDESGAFHERNGEMSVLPRDVGFDVALDVETRRRGIHGLPVYTARVAIAGRFERPATDGIGRGDVLFDWQRAALVLPVADPRGIRNRPEITFGSRRFAFEAAGNRVRGLPPQVLAEAGDLFGVDAASDDDSLAFTLHLEVAGAQRLDLLPTGGDTRAAIRGNWSSPGFSGAYLPAAHSLSADGFSAEWRVSSLGRSFPSRWPASDGEVQALPSAFGVDLVVPIGLYQLLDRATKYAVLFIGLTFVTWFLFEVLTAVRLHPLQYLLTGLANVLFYLLLLSIAEHVGFGPAYLVSAAASTGLIGAYSAAILRGWARALPVSLTLALLYGYLYLTLNAERYAMLAGSIALWTGLALVMFLTRRIDLYRWGREDPAAQADG